MSDLITGESAALFDPDSGQLVGFKDYNGREQLLVVDPGGGGGSAPHTSIAALSATKPAAGSISRLVMGGRTGDFEAVYGDWTEACAGDEFGAYYIPFADDGTPGATGCHRRAGVDEAPIRLAYFGLQAGSTDAVAAGNGARFNAMLNMARESTVHTTPGSGDSVTVQLELPDRGEYHFTAANFTGLDFFSVRGMAPCYFRAPDAVGVDLGGSSKGNFWGVQWFAVADDAGVMPKIGVRLGRVDLAEDMPYKLGDYARKPAERHMFFMSYIGGKASRAMVWNNASEGTEFLKCHVDNSFQGSLDTFEPAQMTAIVALDRYNDFDLGTASVFAPLSSPPGYSGGTHNQNGLVNCRFRSASAFTVPLYINGPMQLKTERLSLVGGARTFVVYGNGGQNENGLTEDSCFDNVLDWHGESANDTVDQMYCVVFNTQWRDFKFTQFRFNELRSHATRAVFHVNGDNRVLLDDLEFVLRAPLGGNRECRIVSQESKSKISGYGSIYVEPVVDTFGTVTMTTTAGSSIVALNINHVRLAAGDVFDISPLRKGAPFVPVDGITLAGRYTVIDAPDTSNITIDCGVLPTLGGVSGNLTPGGISAIINRSRILDIDECFDSFDGTISGGAYPQFVRLPKGNNRVVGLGQTSDVVKANITRAGGWSNAGDPTTFPRISDDTLPLTDNQRYAVAYGLNWEIDIAAQTLAAGAHVALLLTSGIDGIRPTDNVGASADLGNFAGNDVLDVSVRSTANNKALLVLRNMGASSITIPAATWTLQAMRQNIVVAGGSTGGVPVYDTLPSTSGSPQVGQDLVLNMGTCDPAATAYSYTVLRGATVVAGPQNNTSGIAAYVPTVADVGATLVLNVTPRNTAGAGVAQSSVPTAAVLAAATAPPDAPTVTAYSIGPNSIGLLVTPALSGEPATSFKARYRLSTDTGLTVWDQVVYPDSPLIVITGLLSDTDYIGRVYAYNSAGPSTTQALWNVRTLPDAATAWVDTDAWVESEPWNE